MASQVEKLFIGYSRKDKDFALRLARDLRSNGVDIWMDQLDILTGTNWDHSIQSALKNCTGFLIVLSPHAANSRMVMDEMNYALEEDKLVFPVLYKQCEIPFRLRRLQYSDFTGDYDSGIRHLLEAVGGECRSPVLSRTNPGKKRIAVIGLSILGVLVAAFLWKQ